MARSRGLVAWWHSLWFASRCAWACLTVRLRRGHLVVAIGVNRDCMCQDICRQNLQKNSVSGNFFSRAPVRQSRTRKLKRKEVMEMKSIKLLMNVVFLTGSMVFSAVPSRAEVISKKPLTIAVTLTPSSQMSRLALGQPDARKDLSPGCEMLGIQRPQASER
jgi:hypothetical protein